MEYRHLTRENIIKSVDMLEATIRACYTTRGCRYPKDQ